VRDLQHDPVGRYAYGRPVGVDRSIELGTGFPINIRVNHPFGDG